MGAASSLGIDCVDLPLGLRAISVAENSYSTSIKAAPQRGAAGAPVPGSALGRPPHTGAPTEPPGEPYPEVHESHTDGC